MRKTLVGITLLFVAGCTSIQVRELDPSTKISHVCIEENSKVIVHNFVSVIQNGFKRHGITTEIYKEVMPDYCEYHLTYTALKTWDVAMYMHHAEVWMYRGNENIAYAEYHLNGGGGFDLSKWASVDSKMDPVINQLLSGFSPEMVDAYRKAIPINTKKSPKGTNDAASQLRKLKNWHEEGLITKEEYDLEKQKVLSN